MVEQLSSLEHPVQLMIFRGALIRDTSSTLLGGNT